MPLSALFASDGGSTAQQIQAILRAVRRHLAMDVGFVSEFVAGDRVVRYSDGETLHNPLPIDSAAPLPQSFCHYVVQGMMPSLMHDAAAHPVAAALPVTRELPVGAHLSVPLRHTDGTPFGTLCCFSFRPDHSLTARDLGVLRLCADVVAAAFHKERQADADFDRKRARIGAVLDHEAITLAFQPIYRTDDGRLRAFEALARFPVEPPQPPDAWFADAVSVGFGEELELLAIRHAVRALEAFGPEIGLSINLSPAYAASPRFAALLAAVPLDRLVLELTENAVIADYAPLRAALAPLRARGLRLAVDDVGAGHSSFRHILDLSPEIIKLDKSLIRGIDADTSRRALATAITRYSRDIGCEVVAEGVETPAEYTVLRELGMTRVQGYLTGRPVPLADAVIASRSQEPIRLSS
jgi:EAL domain-containing protein (putative c-di-GMP-specific phosphodiesterase class I)